MIAAHTFSNQQITYGPILKGDLPKLSQICIHKKVLQHATIKTIKWPLNGTFFHCTVNIFQYLHISLFYDHVLFIRAGMLYYIFNVFVLTQYNY